MNAIAPIGRQANRSHRRVMWFLRNGLSVRAVAELTGWNIRQVMDVYDLYAGAKPPANDDERIGSGRARELLSEVTTPALRDLLLRAAGAQ